jgi:hypothetical protein
MRLTKLSAHFSCHLYVTSTSTSPLSIFPFFHPSCLVKTIVVFKLFKTISQELEQERHTLQWQLDTALESQQQRII